MDKNSEDPDQLLHRSQLICIYQGSKKIKNFESYVQSALIRLSTVQGHQSGSFIASYQYCVMKWDLFPMNEMDLTFSKTSFFLMQNFRNLKMLFDGLDIYL